MSMQNMRFADAYAAVAEDKRKGVAADIDVLIAAGTEEITDIEASWACLQAQKLIAYALRLDVHDVKVQMPLRPPYDKLIVSVKNGARPEAIAANIGNNMWATLVVYKES